LIVMMCVDVLCVGGRRHGWSWWRVFTSCWQQRWSDSAQCRRSV